jgi:hypothetical protein
MRRRVNEMLKESYPAMVIVDPLADLVVDMIITHVTKP